MTEALYAFQFEVSGRVSAVLRPHCHVNSVCMESLCYGRAYPQLTSLQRQKLGYVTKIQRLGTNAASAVLYNRCKVYTSESILLTMPSHCDW